LKPCNVVYRFMRETLNVKTVKKELIFQSLSRYRQVNTGKGN